jgi:hypothetical protein
MKPETRKESKSHCAKKDMNEVKLWLEIESTTRSIEEGVFSFVKYLELIKSKTMGFKYQLWQGVQMILLNPGRKVARNCMQTAMM